MTPRCGYDASKPFVCTLPAGHPGLHGNERVVPIPERPADAAEERPWDALPPCPLCGGSYIIGSCLTAGCKLSEYDGHDLYFTKEEWRRLASSALPETVVAVLRAVNEYVGDPWATATPGPVQLAMRAWIAAGRPGLQSAGTKEGKS